MMTVQGEVEASLAETLPLLLSQVSVCVHSVCAVIFLCELGQHKINANNYIFSLPSLLSHREMQHMSTQLLQQDFCCCTK